MLDSLKAQIVVNTLSKNACMLRKFTLVLWCDISVTQALLAQATIGVLNLAAYVRAMDFVGQTTAQRLDKKSTF